ncbi:VOC family protein [Rheinheimera riviphila]|uniref:VOC family protein n=1 Tax=Rheinheimera riviphila TaxID=1834037 RepID=A0A437R1D1_9GAMM|nr:VOC family protein [Rheinheimera riviphila]RVU40589.1 VOC family protein [Rheinheimera riviphila]
MPQHLSLVSILVDDYDQAIQFYTRKLGFDLKEDTPQGDKRWVVVAPPGSHESAILLAKASKPEQQALIGGQGAGRVWLFLQTDDFWSDYQRMLDGGVQFLEQPRVESYATVVVFQDLYGNKWDLLQRT